MIRRLSRQALAAFTAWRHRRRVAKADPEIARLARVASDLAAKHRNAAPVRRALHDRVHSNLARELGVTIADRKFS